MAVHGAFLSNEVKVSHGRRADHQTNSSNLLGREYSGDRNGNCKTRWTNRSGCIPLYHDQLAWSLVFLLVVGLRCPYRTSRMNDVDPLSGPTSRDVAAARLRADG